MVKIISVAAVAQNGVIGVSEFNEMPWRLGEYALKNKTFWNSFKPGTFRPADMTNFAKLTTGENYALFMGKNTWKSIPERFRPLDGRHNLVLSTSMPEQDGVTVYRSIQDAVDSFGKYDQVALMGGGAIYQLGMDISAELHINRLHQNFNGDVYFPSIDNKIWNEPIVVPQLVGTEHEGKFSFETYTRR